MMRVESWIVSSSSTRTGSDFCPVIQRTRGTWKPGRSERRTCAMPFQSSAQRAFSLKCEKRNCQRTGGAIATHPPPGDPQPRGRAPGRAGEPSQTDIPQMDASKTPAGRSIALLRATWQAIALKMSSALRSRRGGGDGDLQPEPFELADAATLQALSVPAVEVVRAEFFVGAVGAE